MRSIAILLTGLTMIAFAPSAAANHGYWCDVGGEPCDSGGFVLHPVPHPSEIDATVQRVRETVDLALEKVDDVGDLACRVVEGWADRVLPGTLECRFGP